MNSALGSKLQSSTICPEFSTFSFTNWNIDDEETIVNNAEDALSPNKKMKMAEHAFDINAPAEPLLEDENMDMVDDFDG